MRSVLVAGASGTLGQLIVRSLKEKGFRVRALSRRPVKSAADETVAADLTRAQSVADCCKGIETVISCAGASMNIRTMADRSTFTQVDYLGNMNLLSEAKHSFVRKFVYVSVFHTESLRRTEYCRSHLLFEKALTASGIGHAIVQPTGFYYFLREIAAMAKKGRGIVFGDGSAVSNPVHEEEVAEEAVRLVDSIDRVISIGGPEVLSRKRIVEMAFAAAGKEGPIMSIPPKLFTTLIAPMKIVQPRIHSLLTFGVAVSTIDVVAPAAGKRTLEEYFRSLQYMNIAPHYTRRTL